MSEGDTGAPKPRGFLAEYVDPELELELQSPWTAPLRGRELVDDVIQSPAANPTCQYRKDSFQRREAANEAMYIRKQEMEKYAVDDLLLRLGQWLTGFV